VGAGVTGTRPSGGKLRLADLTGSYADGAGEAPARPEAAVAVPAAAARLPAASATRRPDVVPGAAAAVLAAYDSVQQTPREWVAYSVRLPGVIARELDRRVLADYQATRLQVARSHYVQAALSRLPFADPEKCARVGRDWRASQDRRVSWDGSPPGTRLLRGTAEAMKLLRRQLGTLDARVPLQDVAAGAVAALLAELGEAGAPAGQAGG
jgi:hypothetical protein